MRSLSNACSHTESLAGRPDGKRQDAALGTTDIAVIATAHPQLNYEQIVASAAQVADFRGVARHITADNVVCL